ncbi:MAG: hypothetical protein SPI53_00865 [Erysipelotrichaceae bacterium]|nr:hypothetical protein [Erysipelotrichaceae bacterium]
MKMKVSMENISENTFQYLYVGDFEQINDYYHYEDRMGFKNKVHFDELSFHLLRKSDYDMEIIFNNQQALLKIKSDEGNLEFPIEIIKYYPKGIEVYFKYRLNEQIFIYQIRSING